MTWASALFPLFAALIGLLAGLLFVYPQEIKRGKSPAFQVLIAAGVGCLFLALVALAGEVRQAVALPESVVWLSAALAILFFAIGPLIKLLRSRGHRRP
jgi:phosphatidylserine synthase